jgi:hypothetical protein
MFNKEVSLKISEVNAIKAILPEATLKDMFNLKRSGKIEDVIECREAFPKASIGDIEAIVKCRSFVRWYTKNSKAINAIIIGLPAFSLALYGLDNSSFTLNMLTEPSTVAYAMEPTAIVAFGTPVDTPVLSGLPSAVAAAATPAAAPSASFFNGHGVILLHMLVVGFITMVVCSFLKFTGRGDLIPLVMFVGGAVILYEVIGLFNAIYGAIKTLLQM